MIALYHGKSKFNRVVQKKHRCYYGHGSFVFRDGRNGEAVGSGCRVTDNVTTGHLPGTIIHIFDVGLRTDQYDAIEDFFLSIEGSDYDWPGILGFLTGKIEQPSGSLAKWFCSEALAAGFLKARKPLLRALPAFHTSVRDISISPLIEGPVKIIKISSGDHKMNHNYEAAIRELSAVLNIKKEQMSDLQSWKSDIDITARIKNLKSQIDEFEDAISCLTAPEDTEDTEMLKNEEAE